MYYFSCNLDHVIHGVQFIEKRDKVKKAEEFATSMSTSDFKLFLSQKALYEGESYEQSWDFIFSGDNSLKRCSNFILFLNEMESIITKNPV